MLRTYAFTGRKPIILAALSISFFSLVGVSIWVMSTQISRLFRRPFPEVTLLTFLWYHSDGLIHRRRTQRLFRHFRPTGSRRSSDGRCLSLRSESLRFWRAIRLLYTDMGFTYCCSGDLRKMLLGVLSSHSLKPSPSSCFRPFLIVSTCYW